MADIGKEIREYITNLANASAGAAQEQATNTMGKTNQFDAMAAQIKALTDAVAKLVAVKENKNPNAGGGGGKNGDRKSRCQQMTKLRNMGAYCHSHGFHPVGVNHDSATCGWKNPEHKTEATWGNCLGGDMFWPSAKAGRRGTTGPFHMEGEGSPHSLTGTGEYEPRSRRCRIL